jgi:hypothetical protein
MRQKARLVYLARFCRLPGGEASGIVSCSSFPFSMLSRVSCPAHLPCPSAILALWLRQPKPAFRILYREPVLESSVWPYCALAVYLIVPPPSPALTVVSFDCLHQEAVRASLHLNRTLVDSSAPFTQYSSWQSTYQAIRMISQSGAHESDLIEFSRSTAERVTCRGSSRMQLEFLKLAETLNLSQNGHRFVWRVKSSGSSLRKKIMRCPSL